MLKYQEEYLPVDMVLNDLRAQERKLQQLRAEAHKLGYQVIEMQKAA